ncbi:nuclear transport factor 2 family protein [Sphaerisporangium sp. NPDC051017]|uniref:nuclear transport factor 2 family protein n=1 Tax=Sphaerisporangium sp. NPDC051017 TaxID=3154636 RepID=UPI003420FD34
MFKTRAELSVTLHEVRGRTMEEPSGSDVVHRFYAAVAAKDAEAIGRLIDELFAEDAVLTLPPSLPYGGQVSGARRLRRMFTGSASSTVKVGPVDLRITSVTVGDDRVAVELAFDWYAPGSDDPLATGAVEIWTFADGRVAAIDAYYRDTAACAARVATVSGR